MHTDPKPLDLKFLCVLSSLHVTLMSLKPLVLRFPLLAFGLYFQSQLVDQGVYPVWVSVTHFNKLEIPT